MKQTLLLASTPPGGGGETAVTCSSLLLPPPHHHQGTPTYEIGLLCLFAYGSYAASEAVELSGIMALFFCGLTLAHYNRHAKESFVGIGPLQQAR